LSTLGVPHLDEVETHGGQVEIVGRHIAEVNSFQVNLQPKTVVIFFDNPELHDIFCVILYIQEVT